MTKQEALDLFGGSIRKLSDALGITEQAVRQWGDTVPELRVYQIRELADQGLAEQGLAEQGLAIQDKAGAAHDRL